MSSLPLFRALSGPFHFLRPSEEELRELFPEGLEVLPQPQRIFLSDERATPIQGFVVLITEEGRALDVALERIIEAEEKLAVAIARRRPDDSRAYAAAQDVYRVLLVKALTNVLTASYSQQQPGLFWLYHSLTLSLAIRDLPRRLARRDAALGREQGEHLRFAILERLLDRTLTIAYDVAHRVARETGENEDRLFPRLLLRMRDNLFIFSETHLSGNLSELQGYFQARLQLDGRDFSRRIEALHAWHRQEIERSADLRAMASVLKAGPEGASELLRVPGYVRAMSARADYPRDRLLEGTLLDLWEGLLVRLKEFEVFHALRRLILPVERREEGLVGIGRKALGHGHSMVLSASTRPVDFMSPWVIVPDFERCGLIYDLAEFSESLGKLPVSGTTAQDEGFRSFVRFQRRIARLASERKLRLEKYLGDGAFFSSRDAFRVFVAAVRMQRCYGEAIAAGMPFMHGVRIALGFGSYRFLPLPAEHPGAPEREEFFGEGLVELSRLTTGKALREIDEVRMLMLNLGYPEGTVNRFFAPLLSERLEVVDTEHEKRRFFAYLNRNGTLVNEGIVATGRIIERLSVEIGPRPFNIDSVEGNRYVTLDLEDPDGVLRIGLRKLGLASLKGLHQTYVYEVIDCPVDADREATCPGRSLQQLLEANFAGTLNLAENAEDRTAQPPSRRNGR
jgi:hypothetical protein